MSREPGNFTFFPPARGLFGRYHAFNPLEAMGRATTFHLWRISPNTMSIAEGLQPQSGQDNTGTGEFVNLLLVWNFSVTVRDPYLFYMWGSVLRGFPIANSSAEAVIADLGVNARCDWVEFRKRILIATTTNGLWVLNPETPAAQKAGIAAPPTAPTLAQGAGTGLAAGTFTGVYTYVNNLGHESNPSPVSAPLTMVANKSIDWSGIAAGPATGPIGTVKRNLYRTPSTGGGTYLFIGSINDNTTTVFTENVVDASLGTPVEIDTHTPPPNQIRAIACSRTRVALLDMDGLTVWFSHIDPNTGLPNLEAFPTKLSLDTAFPGGANQACSIAYLGTDFYVWGGGSLIRIVGDIATSLNIEEVMPDQGLFSTFSYCDMPDGFIYLNQFRQLRYWHVGGENQNLGERVQGFLDTIETQGTGPELAYDPMHNTIYLSYSIFLGSYNDQSLAVNLDSGEAFMPGYAFNISHYSPYTRSLYGHTPALGTCIIRGWYADLNETPIYSTNHPLFDLNQNRIEFYPWSPSPGDDIDFGAVQFLVRGFNPVSGVPPMLKVEWALDGAGRYRAEIVNVAKAPIVSPSGEATVVRSFQVGIHRVGRYLTLRITAPDTAATQAQGFEIYKISVDAQVISRSKEARKAAPEGAIHVR